MSAQARTPPEAAQGRVWPEEVGPGICQLTLSNTRRRNALTASMLEALKALFANSPGVRAWLLRGEGREAFCAGYNIESLKHYAPEELLPDELVHEALCALEAHPAPSVALLSGFAYGAGLELAAACDFRVADLTGAFCMPPARLGLIYPLQGIGRLSRLVGPGKARQLFLTGQKLPAPRALEWGLLTELKPSFEEAEACALGLCQNLAAGAPLAIQGMRAALRAQAAAHIEAETLEQLREERRKAYNSEDAREGREAFLQKRPPRFQGR